MVSVIKERLEVGEYSVDPQAVATAMLARCGERGLFGAMWSEVLVAAQPVGGDARERKTLTGHDPA